MNVPAAFIETLSHAPSVGCYLTVSNDPAKLWETLEDQGADLVVLGGGGSPVSGFDLCRMVRGHPRWNRLPIVVVGDDDPGRLDEAMDAGAVDYLPISISAHDVAVRIGRQLSGALTARSRCDIDPLTGTENRASAERSLDHVLRLATRRSEPFALVQIKIDGLGHIRQSEGSAVGDVILRHLGTRLLEVFDDEDVVGRWSSDGFIVGVYGATGEDAQRRIAPVLADCSAEAIPATSGRLARFSFSAGIASFPADGTTFASLEHLCETGLRRAAAGSQAIVLASERPTVGSSEVVDVVLVDDDDSFADVIEHALAHHNYTSLRISDGAEAAAALGEGTVRGRVVSARRRTAQPRRLRRPPGHAPPGHPRRDPGHHADGSIE